jgi:lysophospholipase L1-like esterase
LLAALKIEKQFRSSRAFVQVAGHEIRGMIEPFGYQNLDIKWRINMFASGLNIPRHCEPSVEPRNPESRYVLRLVGDDRSARSDASAISSRRSHVRAIVFLFVAAFLVVGNMSVEAAIVQRADVPAPKLADNGQPLNGWIKMHEAFAAIAKKGEARVVFLGDSITSGWRTKHPKHFQHEFGKYNAVNFAIGGDRTQHVLWRVQNGTLTGLKPKVVVLMIGTNNAGEPTNTPHQIATGIRNIIKVIHNRSPSTKVLLLGIFPRGTVKGDAKNLQVNALISRFHDGRRIHYLDLRKHFLNSKGEISRELMPDYLHLSEKGFKVWADAMRLELAALAR